MIRKLIAIVLGLAINAVILGWLFAAGGSAVQTAPAADAQPTVTLPTIEVRPSAAQLRELRVQRAQATRRPDVAAATQGAACLAMPYYSFATQCNTASGA